MPPPWAGNWPTAMLFLVPGKKVFRNVCLREPMSTPVESSAVEGFVSNFNAEHNIKQVFAEVAGYCSSHL